MGYFLSSSLGVAERASFCEVIDELQLEAGEGGGWGVKVEDIARRTGIVTNNRRQQVHG